MIMLLLKIVLKLLMHIWPVLLHDERHYYLLWILWECCQQPKKWKTRPQAKKLSTGHLTCLEPSKCWIKRLRKRLKKFKNVTLINTYIDQADLQDDTFDIILIHHVLHDIHPDKRADVLKNLSRILKPNGRIYIREPIKKSHGMPYEEIRELFKDIDRDESEFSIKTNKEYSGIYS